MSEIDLFGIGKVAESISEPVKLILGKAIGSPLLEVPLEMVKDPLNFLRWKCLVDIAEKCRNHLESKGIDPNNYSQVPIKSLIPIMELGSLEEDDSLQDRWAKLLASVVAGESIHPSYPKILSELSKPEALILDYLKEPTEKHKKLSLEQKITRQNMAKSYEEYYQKYKDLSKKISDTSKLFKLSEIGEYFSIEEAKLQSFVDNLTRLKLCENPEYSSSVEVITGVDLDDGEIILDKQEIEEFSINYGAVKLTSLGIDFVRVCQGDF